MSLQLLQNGKIELLPTSSRSSHLFDQPFRKQISVFALNLKHGKTIALVLNSGYLQCLNVIELACTLVTMRN